MIVLYTGRRGAGKTLTMVRDAYNYYCDGHNIYSNIELNFEYTYITNEEILNISKTNIKDIILVIDEIQVLIDSRRSGKNTNVNFSHFIQQIRKRNIIILSTTQFSGTVDLRLRQHVDIIARPRIDKELEICEVMYIDITAEDSYDIFYEPKTVIIVYDAKYVYNLYNTLQIVKHDK